MRPVERGPLPLDETGKPIELATYQEARPFLIERLGDYCSYCGMQLSASLNTEHIEAKSEASHLEREWSNLLLACVHCNSTKGPRPVVATEIYLPDRDNTARAFKHLEGGRIMPHPALQIHEQERARKTAELFGLDRSPAGRTPSPADRRWLKRKETWDMACSLLRDWQQRHGDITLRRYIVDLALARGFWSVWMDVFEGEKEIRQALIDAFPGTCQQCFDEETRPLPRPRGAL